MAATDQTEQRKLALVKQLADARISVLGAKLILDEKITEKKSALSEFLNFPKRIKRGFSEQPVKSFAIAIASGLGASFLLKRKSNTKSQQKAIKHSVFKGLTLSIARPILQKLILQYSQQWLAQRAENKFAASQRLGER
ncbi:MAG: hypothetical protein ACI9FG_000735 [Crocinitomicaceae bacterium]|jgi:hypothetical protein